MTEWRHEIDIENDLARLERVRDLLLLMQDIFDASDISSWEACKNFCRARGIELRHGDGIEFSKYYDEAIKDFFIQRYIKKETGNADQG